MHNIPSIAPSGSGDRITSGFVIHLGPSLSVPCIYGVPCIYSDILDKVGSETLRHACH